MIISECNKDDISFLNENLVKYNASMVPFTQDEPFIELNYKIQEDEKTVAGIIAVLYCWGCLNIDLLYVDENYRCKGYGRQLMTKVESEGKKHSCHLIHLDTFDFQAKDFYLKQGFSVFGTLPNCPKGHTRYYLKKDI